MGNLRRVKADGHLVWHITRSMGRKMEMLRHRGFAHADFAATLHTPRLLRERGEKERSRSVAGTRNGILSGRKDTMNDKWTYLVVGLALVALAVPAVADDPGMGNILFEFWYGGGINDNLDNLKADPDFLAGVAHDSEWVQSFQAEKSSEDNYGGRGRGYVYPPQTGDYTFWIYSDDDGELHLSTDEDPANAVQIAGVEGWTARDEWDKSDTQQSDPIALVAGQRYYIEALFSDGTADGFLGVGWGGPGIGAGPVIIDGTYLAPLLRDPGPMLMARDPSPADGAQVDCRPHGLVARSVLRYRPRTAVCRPPDVQPLLHHNRPRTGRDLLLAR